MSYTLVNDNCFDWMRQREENSITAIVTDPPYGVKEYTDEEIEIAIRAIEELAQDEE